MIIEITLRNIYDKCPFPCKPGGILKFCPGLRLGNGIDNLPLCTDEIKTTCFQESFRSAMQFIESESGPGELSNTLKKLEYQVAKQQKSMTRLEFELKRHKERIPALECEKTLLLDVIQTEKTLLLDVKQT